MIEPGPCPACGWIVVTIRYRRRGQIRCRCDRCAFEWDMKPLDQAGKAGGSK